jgi:DNA-binding SARP family transcriptional activator/class 3 adenylate cyclase
MDALRLELLGGFALRAQDGAPAAFTQRKVMALLAYLALNPGQPHARDKLTALLWADSAPEQARGSLRQALAALRRALPDGGEGMLVADVAAVSLLPGALALDVDEFRAAARGEAPGDAERAEALYRGDLLEGVVVPAPAFEEWAAVERARLREEAADALRRALDRAAADGGETAVRIGLRLLALDPLQEPVHRAMMRLYARQRRFDAALRQYQACRDVLERELGVAPEPETEALARELREQRRAPRPADAPRPRAPAPPAEPPAGPPAGPPASAAEPGPAVPAKAERRSLTVLHALLDGYDEMVHREDPEDVRLRLRRWYGLASAAVAAHGGTVNNYQGPGIIAVFGHPAARETDAEEAVAAGLAVVAATRGAVPPIGTARVGIATGLVVIGDVLAGPDLSVRELVGEAPNLAVRICHLAPPGTVLANRRTRRLVGELFAWREAGAQMVSGRADPVQLHEAVGDGAVASRFHATRGAGGSFVGREMEAGLLLDRWQAACAGEGQVVLLGGEPGIGKSRIVEAMHQRLAGTRHDTVRLQCSPGRAGSDLYPVIRHVEAQADLRARPDPEARRAALEAFVLRAGADPSAVAPVLAELFGAAADGEGLRVASGGRMRERLFRALCALLVGRAEQAPVLIVVEDAQWLDPTSADLMAEVVDLIAARRVLIVATHRPGWRPAWLDREHVTALAINRLGRAHSQRIVEQIAGDRPLPPEAAEAVLAKADGVPLFLEELTRAALEAAEGGRQGADAAAAVPDTLQDLLRARLERSGPALRAAQIAAAVGREVHADLVVAVDGRPEAEVRADLDRLVAAGLLQSRGGLPADQYAFKHALVQEAAHDSLLKEERRAIHARIAEALAARGGDAPEEVARHLEEAGDADRASALYLEAGRRALARSAQAEALGHLDRAQAALAALPPAPERAARGTDVRLARGNALIVARGFADASAGAAFAEARRLAEAAGDDERLVRALGGLWQCDSVRGDFEAGLADGLRILELGERRDHDPYRLIGHCAVGGSNLFLGWADAASGHLNRALGVFRRAPTLSDERVLGGDTVVYAMCFAAHAHWLGGRHAAALASLESAAARAERTGQPFGRAVVLGYGATLRAFRREPAEARALAEEGAEFCREHGFPYYRAWCLIIRAWADAAEGDASGLGRMAEGLALLRSGGTLLRVPMHLAMEAELMLGLGRTGDALAALEEARDLVGRTGEAWQRAEVERLRGIALARSDRAAADAAFRAALASARSGGARMHELRAAAAMVRAGFAAGADAAALLRPPLAAVRDGDDLRDVREARELLAEAA